MAANPPEAVVVDVRMPPTFTDEGLRAALVVRDRWPEVGVLVLSQWVEERYATELISGRPHGVGYLLKTGSRTSGNSSTRYRGWLRAAVRSIPKSSRSCSPAAATRSAS